MLGVSDDGKPYANAFWNANLPPEVHTPECPDFLRYCFENAKDRNIIGTPDGECQRLTWTEVKDIARQHRPDLFQRLPSDLRRYREYCARLKTQYGSVNNFIMQERLNWRDTQASGPVFTNADDYKILFNDWPYAVDERIVHLVVWTRFRMTEDPHTGFLIPDAACEIQEFIEKTFNKAVGSEHVIWFRNWTSLKSVHAVEHFHIMLFDPDPDFISKLTGGDSPLGVRSMPDNTAKYSGGTDD